MTDDVLLNALGSAGKNVKITDGRLAAPKTRKKSTKASMSSSGLVDWKDVVDGAYEVKLDVRKWVNKDFLFYFDDLFGRKFGVSKRPMIAFWNGHCKRLNEALVKASGQKYDPVMKKAYLDYFFDHEMDKLMMKTNGFFKFEFLEHYFTLMRFVKQWKPAPPPEVVVEKPAPVIGEGASFTKEEMDGVARLGLQALIVRYGLALTVNFLLTKLPVTPDRESKVVPIVESAAANAVQGDKKFWISIKKATEKYGPYPKWLPWLGLTDMAKRIETQAGVTLKPIEVATCDDSTSFGFLR